jgi:DNA mismatch repair protein MutL
MPKIVRLPENVVNQIAAGEVVERPLAVVKELVENALDAGARRIDVEFHQGGKALIRITDDGCGMSRDDAALALERHATSKIRGVDDILKIGSFGFRGEALPSIASVSRFTLRTRRAEDAVGTEIMVDGGRRHPPRDCGMPPGTMVEVAQLFNSVPARRKFLKTDRTEAGHILQICRLLAVAHHDIAFTVSEDGRVLWQSPPARAKSGRVEDIYGRAFARELTAIEHREGEWRLHGLVSKPGTGRVTRADMYTFVNQRPVDSRLLSYALIESYHTWIPKGRYPIAFLFLEIPPDAVDVNVHPAKREVRFREDGQVRRFVMEGLLALLRQLAQPVLVNAQPVTGIGPVASLPWGAPVANTQPGVSPGAVPAAGAGGSSADLTTGPRPVAGVFRAGDAPDQLAPPRPAAGTAPAIAAGAAATGPQPAAAPAGGQPAGRQIPWQYRGELAGPLYLFEGRDGLIILNPVAARERIHYERIRDSLQTAAPATQPLLFPGVIELDPPTAKVAEEHAAALAAMGFQLEPFGRHVFRLEAVPAWFAPDHGEQFLLDWLQLVRERGWHSGQTDAVHHAMAQQAAQRIARWANKQADQPLALADALLQCRSPLADPAGRPTLIEIRHSELQRRFTGG